MKFITCASYYGTGSSAVTDLINECDNVHNMGDYEFRFIQDPDGIRDLEYNLVENNHRHNSGYALRRYWNNVKFLSGSKIIKKYNRFFGDQWQKLSKKYVDDLTDIAYKGSWHQELRDKGKVAYFLERLINKIAHGIFRINRDKNIQLFLRNNIEFGTFPQDKFYDITIRYIEDLFTIANFDNKEFIMADQLVPASNTMQYLKYFNDIKVVCVDRDPRDLFILEKEVWKGTIIPKKVEDFCKWLKVTRAHRKYEQDNPKLIMRINFEQLIYHYDLYAPQILSFCGLTPEHHVLPKTLLIPEVSIKNTQLYKKYGKYNKDISVIEQELEEYLFDFDGVNE